MFLNFQFCSLIDPNFSSSRQNVENFQFLGPNFCQKNPSFSDIPFGRLSAIHPYPIKCWVPPAFHVSQDLSFWRKTILIQVRIDRTIFLVATDHDQRGRQTCCHHCPSGWRSCSGAKRCIHQNTPWNCYEEQEFWRYDNKKLSTEV